jgi:hypothetical protein
MVVLQLRELQMGKGLGDFQQSDILGFIRPMSLLVRDKMLRR